MKKSNKMLMALLLACMSAMMVGCSENEDGRQAVSGQQITFAPTVATDWNGAVTRAAMQQNATAKVQQLTDGLYLHTVVSPGFESDRQQVTRGTKLTNSNTDFTEFMVAGYRYGNGLTLAGVKQNFFSLLKVEKDNLQQWKALSNYTWPMEGDALSFYAYWPCETGNNTHVSVVDQNGPMTINFTVDAALANQVDLMTATAQVADATTVPTGTVTLPFAHRLTAVKFVLGDEKDVVPGTIKSISFENIYNAGQYNIGTDTWSCSQRSTMSVDFGDGIATSGNAELIGDDNVLLMIPQAFDDNNQCIKIVVNDGKQDTELQAVLNGTNPWLAGTTVTYKVSTTALNCLSINSLTFPTTWGTDNNEVPVTYPFKSAYADGDTIGVYAVDGSGKVIFDNVKYKLNGTTWEKTDTRDVFYPSTYTFYAYYPYKATLSGAPAKGTNVKTGQNLPLATEFFATAMTNWPIAAVQNSEALINAQDLQVGVGTSSDGSTVNFPTMVHAMGLASVTMGTKEVTKVRYFTGMTSNVAYNTTEKDNVTAAPCFVTNLPLESGGLYYYIVNGSRTFTADANNSLKWSSVTAEVASGQYRNVTVTPTRDYKYRGWVFPYTDSAQDFAVPVTGTYTIECWGAQGGTITGKSYEYPNGGLGGYTAGDISLDRAQVAHLYIYTGQKGVVLNNSETAARTFNGGGRASAPDGACASGGGATDVRLFSGAWTDYNGIKTRIMVAGGGAGCERSYLAGAAGGLESYSSRGSEAKYATQTYGYRLCYGEDGDRGTTASGAGGGYLGGITGMAFGYEAGPVNSSQYLGYLASSGGSSFISGHRGCRAIDFANTTTSTRNILDNGVGDGSHPQVTETFDVITFMDNTDTDTYGSVFSYGNITYRFSNTVIVDGQGYSWTTEKGSQTGMPKTGNASGTENGHEGDGYCRITSHVVE